MKAKVIWRVLGGTIVVLSLVAGIRAFWIWSAEQARIHAQTVAEERKAWMAQATVDSGFANALDVYRRDMGDFPRTDDGGVRLLVEPPQDVELAKKWAGWYAKGKDLVDPWGHEYIYQYPGKHNKKGYDLSSAGPDGQEGTDDDFVNWKRP